MGCGSSQSLEGTVASSPTEFKKKANDIWDKVDREPEPERPLPPQQRQTQPLPPPPQVAHPQIPPQLSHQTTPTPHEIAKPKETIPSQAPPFAKPASPPQKPQVEKPVENPKPRVKAKPAEYKYDVSDVWIEVDQSVGDNNKNMRKQIVVKRSGWKTIRIFVSSTFKDFHAEREVLVKEVSLYSVSLIIITH